MLPRAESLRIRRAEEKIAYAENCLQIFPGAAALAELLEFFFKQGGALRLILRAMYRLINNVPAARVTQPSRLRAARKKSDDDTEQHHGQHIFSKVRWSEVRPVFKCRERHYHIVHDEKHGDAVGQSCRQP